MKHKVEVATLPVQLPSQPTQSTCVSLVQALLKHLLYARGHIPYIYDQLLQQTLEEEEQDAQQSTQPGRKRRRRLKKSDKRRLQVEQQCIRLGGSEPQRALHGRLAGWLSPEPPGSHSLLCYL